MMTFFDLNIFIQEKLILKRNIVFAKFPILFTSIDDTKMDTFLKNLNYGCIYQI